MNKTIKSREDKAIAQYNQDIHSMEGYIYTGIKARKSMDIFNRRATLAIQSLIDMHGKSVIDIGCGDGTYTVELVTTMGASSSIGIEPSDAWKLGQKKYAQYAPSVQIRHGNAYALDFPDKFFDLAIMRGVIHHLDDPIKGLQEMSRVAKNVFLLEPNGFNPIIKLLEKVSSYHRAHGEKSYTPSTLRRWLVSLGGTFCGESFSSLVPLLCPTAIAEFLDWLSPKWEQLPFIAKISCGLYCVHFCFDKTDVNSV
jgi:SAM-dependent methyltransferase